MIIGVVIKQPWEVLDYDIDCRPAYNVDGDTDKVIDVAWSVTPDEPNGLEVEALIMGEDFVKCWFYGGNEDVDYMVELYVTTQAGRHKEDEIDVRIREYE
jgi:hypothetical protein